MFRVVYPWFRDPTDSPAAALFSTCVQRSDQKDCKSRPSIGHVIAYLFRKESPWRRIYYYFLKLFSTYICASLKVLI